MFVLRRVRAGLTWVMFESRGKAIEQRILQQVEEFLHTLWKQGALGRASPEEAYRVTVEEDLSQLCYQLSMQLTLAPHNYVTTLCFSLPSSDAF
jgi:phage tail sheath protein FI